MSAKPTGPQWVARVTACLADLIEAARDFNRNASLPAFNPVGWDFEIHDKALALRQLFAHPRFSGPIGVPVSLDAISWLADSIKGLPAAQDGPYVTEEDGFAEWTLAEPQIKALEFIYGKFRAALDQSACESEAPANGDRVKPQPPDKGITGARPDRAFKKGELDARATAALMSNPRLSNEQIAAMMGCHVKTLSKPHMMKFLTARETLKDGRAQYHRADETRNGTE